MRSIPVLALIGLVLIAALNGCDDNDRNPSSGATPTVTPTRTPVSFQIVASEPRFVVPSSALPAEVQPFASNNNVDIAIHDGRLFFAWRSAPTHFASVDTRMYIISSADGGQTWDFEHEIRLGADMREPRFLALGDDLQLMFFEAGTNPGAFEPQKLWRTRRIALGQWHELEILTDAGEVPWDLKVYDGRAYRTSYMGTHYGAGETSDVSVFFKTSTDGTEWTEVGSEPHVYFGGVSEVAFELDTDGSLWAVTRNEDGDETGFGSHVCYAPAAALGDWECSAHTDPERYDSPEMFRHGDEIYLVARRDIGGPYDRGDADLSLAERRSRYLVEYSLRPKRTALYRINKTTRSVEHVLDLPGVGDTAFPSVQQTGPDSYLLANYTSPLDSPDVSWLRGQTSNRGTQLYLLDLTFIPYAGATHTPTPTSMPTVTPTPTPGAGVDPRQVIVSPVFAAPAVPLAIEWPLLSELTGRLDLGDETSVGPDVATHTYASNNAIYEIRGFVESNEGPLQLAGAVARTDFRAQTPLSGFTLTQPMDSAAKIIIKAVVPAFYWAADDSRLAFASDPTNMGVFGFEEVTVTPVSRADDGTFTSAEVDFTIELVAPGGMASGRLAHVTEGRLSGTIEGASFVGPVMLAGRLNVQDVIDGAVTLAGLDQEQAVAFLAGLFGFDPEQPPETIPFAGNLVTQAPSSAITAAP